MLAALLVCSRYNQLHTIFQLLHYYFFPCLLSASNTSGSNVACVACLFSATIWQRPLTIQLIPNAIDTTGSEAYIGHPLSLGVLRISQSRP
jgi:hypothetical protein